MPWVAVDRFIHADAVARREARWARCRAAAEVRRHTRRAMLQLSLIVIAASARTEAALAQTEVKPPRSEDEVGCMAFLDGAGESHRHAHENKQCLRAADAGFGPAQYSVGMGFGFAGDHAAEEKYYRLAADRQVIAAYLGLGHLLAESNPWEAIYWYQRYVALKPEGYGYAALLASRIFERLGERGQAEYWLGVCKTSGYEGCR